MFDGVYNHKKVLITGHTGFKGSWLTTWLLELGAEICGVSIDIPTKPSLFEALGLEQKIDHNIIDVRDIDSLNTVIESFEPDFLFHLAAQPIVSLSYSDPLSTLSTNVMGTANVLECLRHLNRECCAVIITSDKCYENVEWEWGYKETDHLGGKDIYSGSKGAAEIVFHAYQESFFKTSSSTVRLATGRAGNVIGGGDWAADRIVADSVKAWSQSESVEIRCPTATRPWQHVLEPISGYLTLGQKLSESNAHNGEQFNFGPRAEQNRTVQDLLDDMSKYWSLGDVAPYHITDHKPFHEAGLLKLNCDKALFRLRWEANLVYEQCIKLVSEWYYAYYTGTTDMFKFTKEQIEFYQQLARENKRIWAR